MARKKNNIEGGLIIVVIIMAFVGWIIETIGMAGIITLSVLFVIVLLIGLATDKKTVKSKKVKNVRVRVDKPRVDEQKVNKKISAQIIKSALAEEKNRYEQRCKNRVKIRKNAIEGSLRNV